MIYCIVRLQFRFNKFFNFKYIKSRIVMAKAAFNKKKNLFTGKLDLNLRKKLVKWYVWSMALYGAETWTLRENRTETPGKF